MSITDEFEADIDCPKCNATLTLRAADLRLGEIACMSCGEVIGLQDEGLLSTLEGLDEELGRFGE